MNNYLVIDDDKNLLNISLYNLFDRKEVVKLSFNKIIKNDKTTYKYNDNGVDIYFPNYKILLDNVFKNLIKGNIITSVNDIEFVSYKISNYANSNIDSIVIDDSVADDNIKYIREIIPNVKIVGSFNDYHRISHRYVNKKMKELTAREDIDFISCYIGSEVSINSYKDGKYNSIPISFTPLEILTKKRKARYVSLKVVNFIAKMKNISNNEVVRLIDNNNLNLISSKEDLEYLYNMSDKNEIAKIAFENYIDYIVKNIIYYYNIFNKNINAIILTGYIGEKNSNIRKKIVDKLNIYGVKLNNMENFMIGNDIENGIITDNNSTIPIFVIKSNELEILLDDISQVIENGIVLKKINNDF